MLTLLKGDSVVAFRETRITSLKNNAFCHLPARVLILSLSSLLHTPFYYYSFLESFRLSFAFGMNEQHLSSQNNLYPASEKLSLHC